ncbi:unnamed protein product [Cutaneotrichosporon oleaginosum]
MDSSGSTVSSQVNRTLPPQRQTPSITPYAEGDAGPYEVRLPSAWIRLRRAREEGTVNDRGREDGPRSTGTLTVES